MKVLKCSIQKIVHTPSRSLLFGLLALLASFLSVSLLSSPASAISETTVYGHYFYGLKTGQSPSRSWSDRFTTQLSWYSANKYSFHAERFTPNGKYASVDFGVILSPFNTAALFYSQYYPTSYVCTYDDVPLSLQNVSFQTTSPAAGTGTGLGISFSFDAVLPKSTAGTLSCEFSNPSGSFYQNNNSIGGGVVQVISSGINVFTSSQSFPTTPSDDQANFDKLFNQNSQIISGLGSVNGSIKDLQNQSHKDAQNTQNAINNASDQAHKDSQAQTDAINNQAQQEQDRYDKDKQEESDRENQGKDDADSAKGMFSFSFLNPFVGIFELFNPSGCVQIPTIAGMVGSDDTTYCPWFPASVINILTPVLGMASMMLLFGFVVGWLNGNDVDGSISVKGGK